MFFTGKEERIIYFVSLAMPLLWFFYSHLVFVLVWLFIAGLRNAFKTR